MNYESMLNLKQATLKLDYQNFNKNINFKFPPLAVSYREILEHSPSHKFLRSKLIMYLRGSCNKS